MKEKPILFSGPMVRAILEGRKTQTRRVVKRNASGRVELRGKQWHIEDPNAIKACPYGQPGERLWVKETHQWCECCGSVDYAADVNRPNQCRSCDHSLGKWRPSIFMFRRSSRITLEIVAVRVERLQEISEADAIAEGIERSGSDWESYDKRFDRFMMAESSYRSLWESINGEGSWAANPWVWVVEFKKLEATL